MDSSPRRTVVLDFCEREIGNVVDRYAVAAKNDSRITVGHLPRKISRICSIFLMGGGTITATVTGRRRSRELRNYASHNLTRILMARIESNARLKSSRK